MLFKKVSNNYYQAVDSKGNARRISKSRYLKETASKKVSRKNKKSYSRAVIQQLGGAGNINFKNINSMVFIASSSPITEKSAHFGGWKLADRYTRQALDSVLANYNFGSLNAGREVGFCFVDCDGSNHTKILNAKNGSSNATLHIDNSNQTVLEVGTASNLSQFNNPFQIDGSSIKHKRMVGNFIGMSDIVSATAGNNLPDAGNKRIWIMIVKVTEPNNCTIGAYSSVGAVVNPNNYFSGRTMYRYYRCMPIYQSGTIGTDVELPKNQLATMGQTNGVHALAGGSADIINVAPGTIIGFASFQELTILELASHQGNVLGYLNQGDNQAAAATAEGGSQDWQVGSSMQQSMLGGTSNKQLRIYNEKVFEKWNDFTHPSNKNAVAMGILADIRGVEDVTNANQKYINKSGNDLLYDGSNINSITGNDRKFLNGAVVSSNETNLNRNTWVGCHTSVHLGLNDAVALDDNKPHSNHAILARLLRKYNTIGEDYTPSVGGNIEGSPANGNKWDGSDGSKPVWLPSIINKSSDSVIKSSSDTLPDDGIKSMKTDIGVTGLDGNKCYSVAGHAADTTNNTLESITGYRAAAGNTLYVTNNVDAPTYNTMKVPAEVVGVPSRALLFL